jgi:hypothetical protein
MEFHHVRTPRAQAAAPTAQRQQPTKLSHVHDCSCTQESAVAVRGCSTLFLVLLVYSSSVFPSPLHCSTHRRSGIRLGGWPPGLPGRGRLADRRPALLLLGLGAPAQANSTAVGTRQLLGAPSHQRSSSSPTSLLLCDPSKGKELHHSLIFIQFSLV